MGRRSSLGLRAALLFCVVVLFVGTGKSYAQEADIKAAIDAFHSALGTLNISKLEPLWAHDAHAMLINPRDKEISVGWDAIKRTWEETLNTYSELKVTQTNGPHIHVDGDVAWSMGIVNAALKLKSGYTANSPTIETDVFEKHAGKWLLISHAASRIPQ